MPSDNSVTGIGDDAAVIDKTGPGKMLVTTDALVEGVHFLRGSAGFFDIGYKSIAVNMSDIASMGGIPAYALLTLGVSGSVTENEIESFIEGLLDIREKQPFDLIGGDTVSSPNVFISVTMIGYADSAPILRRNAMAGENIYLTGNIGDSSIGLSLIKGDLKKPVLDEDYFIKRHYRPAVRVSLMQYLKKKFRIGAAIDISDGLLADLSHIAEESMAGFRIYVEKLPMSLNRIGEAFSSSEEYFYNFALGGGEDYEVLFTSPDIIDTERVLAETGAELTCIGRIEKNGREVIYKEKILDWDGLKKGYEHF